MEEKGRNNFGHYLRYARQRKGLSILDLAAKSGISQSYLSRLELGQRDTPTVSTLSKIANALGVNPHILLNTMHMENSQEGFELIHLIKSGKIRINGKELNDHQCEVLTRIFENFIELFNLKGTNQND